MGRKLTQVEELMILRQAFFDFCLLEIKNVFWGENDFNIGKFIVKDKYKENETPQSLLGKLLKVDSQYYDENKKSQRVLANVKISIEIIEKKKEQGENYIYLQDIHHMSLVEIKAYHQLLSYVMEIADEDGKLIYPSEQIVPKRLYYACNDEYKGQPPNCGSSVQSIQD